MTTCACPQVLQRDPRREGTEPVLLSRRQEPDSCLAEYRDAMNARSTYLQVERTAGDELVREHAGLVRRIAFHLLARLPPNVDVHDLIQSGMVGLLEAARSYMSDRSTRFETFATPRIRGAMLDELRRGDWAPRSVRRKVREMAQITRQVESETGAEATKPEVMRRMEIGSKEYDQILVDAVNARILNLPDEDDGGRSPALSESTPESETEAERLRQALAAAIDGLPQREKQVVSLYYQEELNLKEVGAVLGVTESRACQIHGQAIVRLQARLRDWWAQG